MKPKNIHDILKKLFITSLISFIISLIWMFAELLIEEQIANRPIDNLMMCFMMVFIWYTVNYFDSVSKTKIIKNNNTTEENI